MGNGGIISLVLLGVLLIALPISRVMTRHSSNGKLIELGRLKGTGDKAAVMRFCLEILRGNDPKSLKETAAHTYCQIATEYGDERYEAALPFLAEVERLCYRAMFLSVVGDYPGVRQVCKEVLALGKKKYIFFAYDRIGLSYIREFRYRDAYEAFMKGATVEKRRRERSSLAFDAYCCALKLFDAQSAEAAYSLFGKKTAKNTLLQKESFESTVAFAKKRGVDLKEYTQKLYGALEEYRLDAFYLIDAGDIPNPRNFTGGTFGYDNEKLRREQAHFYAQICFSDIPDARYRKPYALRFWLTNAEEEIAEGVYKCDFADQSNGADPTRLMDEKPSVAMIVKGKEKPFRREEPEERMKFKRNNVFKPGVFRFSYGYAYPAGNSLRVKQVCAEKGLPLPDEAFGKASPLKDFALMQVGGYAYGGKFAAQTEEYDFCLLQIKDDDNYVSAYLMRSKDYKEDNFQDVIFVRQKKESAE